MNEQDIKIQRQAEFTRQHTLNPEQLKKLLEGKMIRARQYHEASRKREEVCGRR